MAGKVHKAIGILGVATFLLVILGGCASTPPPPPPPQQDMLDILGRQSPDMTLHGQATGPLVKADAIPVAHTPKDGYTVFPDLVLKDCNEPIAPGIPDISGLWVSYTGGNSVDHMERIEQAGNRVVITSKGVIHDMVADGTAEHGVNDVTEVNYKTPVHVAAKFEKGGLSLYPFGLFAYATRRLEGNELVLHWGSKIVRMKRVPYSLLPWLLAHGAR